MFKLIFKLIFIIVVFPLALHSQDYTYLKLKEENNTSYITPSRQNVLRAVNSFPEFSGNNFQVSVSYYNSKKSSLNKFEFKNNRKKKSVALGTILSAILPGAGEFYGESYLKAGIFLGIEILAWATYLYFDQKGDKKDEEFRRFADQNWDVRRYARWLNDQFDQTINWQEPDLQELRRQIIRAEQELRFSHTLPEYYTQQYYEVIGKYQTFMGGWADAENGFGNWVVTGGQGGNYYTYQTPMFRFYAGERQKANDFYDLARIGPITAILNHILSAADAAWTISNYNKRIKLETGFRIKNYLSPYSSHIKHMATFNLRLNF